MRTATISFIAGLLLITPVLLAQSPEPCVLGSVPLPGFVPDRFLLPLYFVAPVDGALGSRWVTEAVISNGGTDPVEFNNVGGSGPFHPVFNTPLSPGVTTSLVFTRFDATEIPARFLDIQEGAADVSVQLRVRDISREAISYGAELPVVNHASAVAGAINIAGVPFAPDYRQLLRVYDFSQLPDAAVNVRVFGVDPGSSVNGPADTLIGELALPLHLGACDQPGYAQTADLAGLVGAGSSRIMRIEIKPTNPDSRIWAFVTLTNNTTQQVTVMTPKAR